MNSIFRFKLITAVLLICFSLVFCISTLSYAEETVDTNNTESISQNTSTTSSSSKISKNSDTYKILVALTVISIIVVIILFSYLLFLLAAEEGFEPSRSLRPQESRSCTATNFVTPLYI